MGVYVRYADCTIVSPCIGRVNGGLYNTQEGHTRTYGCRLPCGFVGNSIYWAIRGLDGEQVRCTKEFD